MQYWIIVVSKDHIARGVAGGFIQANYGKEGPLKRMAVNDWIIVYSPKESYAGNEPLKAFTAIGQVADDKIYQHKMTSDFIPYRRNIKYYTCKETPIAPLIDKLDFIKNKTSWGYQFRFGFFGIPEDDFKLICSKMIDLFESESPESR
jgi:predicted RNA-binding protein